MKVHNLKKKNPEKQCNEKLFRKITDCNMKITEKCMLK